jgi:hypothetical protein
VMWRSSKHGQHVVTDWLAAEACWALMAPPRRTADTTPLPCCVTMVHAGSLCHGRLVGGETSP